MEQQVIDRLREYYDLPEWVSDEQISTDFHGSTGLVLINLSNALDNLQKEFRKALNESWLFRKLKIVI